MTYLAITQSPLVIYLGLVQMYEGGIIPFNVNVYFIETVIGAILFILIAGWIETTIIRGYQEEQKIWFNRNPQLVEMKKDIEEIKEMLKSIIN